MIRVGIIGTGLIAQYHAGAILSCGADLHIEAICDINADKMDRFADGFELKEVRKYTDYRQMVDEGGLDLISVCTDNDAHKEISVYAAEHGINLLCEKPLGLNAEEVKVMADACEKNHIINMTGFTYRRIPAMSMIKQLIDNGDLGRIYHYRARFYADRMAAVDHPLEWRHIEAKAGSGVLGDLASHILDMALYLLEGQCRKITDVYADAAIYVPYRKDPDSGEMVKVTTEDACDIIAHFEDGTEVILENTRYSPFEVEIHISGEKGSLKYNLSDYDEIQLMLYDSPANYFSSFKTVKVPEPQPAMRPMPTDRMARQYIYLADCIDKGEAAHPTIEETIYIQELLDVMKESYKQEKKLTL